MYEPSHTPYNYCCVSQIGFVISVRSCNLNEMFTGELGPLKDVFFRIRPLLVAGKMKLESEVFL